MATFRVGQRVRFVKSTNVPFKFPPGVVPIPKGSVGVLVGFGTLVPDEFRHLAERWDWRIKYDSDPREVRGVFSWQIEPIVDEGRQVITWDATSQPWVPPHLREETKEKVS